MREEREREFSLLLFAALSMREKVTITCSVQIAGLFVDISFIVVNGSTAGDLQFQWAQNTSNSTAVKVEQRSFLLGSKF